MDNNPQPSRETQIQGLENLLKSAESIMQENLKHGKSPQSAITIACISIGVDPSPLKENAILDYLWEKIYQNFPPEEF
jgi:hypothetical protein